MNLKRLLAIFFCISPGFIVAQTESASHLLLELSTGADLGWWLYQKGSVHSYLDQGQDYTHHAVTLGVEADLLYRLGRWKLGLGLSYSGFFENEMLGTKDSEYLYDRYEVSKGAAVPFFRFNLQTEYLFIQKKIFEFGPQLRYGWFAMNTTHPEKENFGYRSYWEVGLQNEFKLHRFSIFFRPKYQYSAILPKKPKQTDEKHKIYGIGLQVGLRLALGQ